MRIMFMGTPEFAAQSLRTMVEDGGVALGMGESTPYHSLLAE